MAIVVQLTSLTFEKRKGSTGSRTQSRTEVKGEKLTFHLICILWLSIVSFTEERDGNSLKQLTWLTSPGVVNPCYRRSRLQSWTRAVDFCCLEWHKGFAYLQHSAHTESKDKSTEMLHVFFCKVLNWTGQNLLTSCGVLIKVIHFFTFRWLFVCVCVCVFVFLFSCLFYGEISPHWWLLKEKKKPCWFAWRHLASSICQTWYVNSDCWSRVLYVLE